MTSNYAYVVTAELEALEAASRLRVAHFVLPQRPWLDLYGVNIKPVAPLPYSDPALIHQYLPDEIIFEIFSRMSPYTMGRASCVCRKWRYISKNPVLWRNACLKASQFTGAAEIYKLLHSKYDGSWRKMWLLRPRVRTDGLYVSRNTAEVNHNSANPIIGCYYRYLRFYPSGRFVYQNSSLKVKDAVKCMNFRDTNGEWIFSGQYKLSDDKVDAAFLYPYLRPTVWRMRLGLRGTTAGANNRMDPLELVTSGVREDAVNKCEEDILGIVGGHNYDVKPTSHQRGLAPFVFVPFEEVETSVLNLPVKRMDYYLCGAASV